MLRDVLILSLGLLFAGRVFGALDPAQSITGYTQRVWGLESGLPQKTVTSIAQTPDGYIWLGTEEGLARFDGVRFSVFDRSNTPGLGSNRISRLLTGSDGTLWIGTESGGLTQYSKGRFRTFDSHNGLASDTVLSLFEDHQKNLWIGTNGGGLNCFSKGQFKVYTTKTGLPNDAVFSIAGNQEGGLWLGTHAGLALFSHGRFTTYTQRDGLGDDYVRDVVVDRDGSVWAATNGHGVSRFANGRFTNYSKRDGLSSDSTWSLAQDSRGTMWVATLDGGVNRFQKGRFVSYTANEGLPTNRVLSLFEDREGSFWVGSGGGGIARLTNSKFTVLTTATGLSNNVVLPVFEDREGFVWVGTNGGGVNRFKDGQMQKFTVSDGLADNVVLSLAQDQAGAVWIATRRGVSRYDHGQFKSFSKKDGLPDDLVLCFYADRQGVLWAGTRAGLGRFDGIRFQTFTTKDGLSNNYVLALYEDHNNTLWIGTGGGGLNRLQNGKFSAFTTKDGLSNNAIWSLQGDRDGTLWIGTSGGGLNRLTSGRFTAFSTKQGLPDDEVFQILSDDLGYLWMTSNRGISRVAKWQLDAYARGRRSTIAATTYGVWDGLKNQECNGGFQPAGWKSRKGELLFPTMQGLAVVDPKKVSSVQAPPRAILERANADGKYIDLAAPKDVPPGNGRLQFDFTAPSFLSPQNITFRYKLEGFDSDWIEAGTRRVAYYTNIPPGLYRFRVTAMNQGGDWNEQQASLRLVLRPHFVQTWTFKGCCLAITAGICLFIYRIRIAHLKQNEQKLLSLVEQRTCALQNEVYAKEKAHAELAEAQQHLVDLSRLSGMAEVATNVLHNVGNVLNSVNVSSTLLTTKARAFRLDKLTEAVRILEDHRGELSEFVTCNPKGQRVLPYLSNLSQHLQAERGQMLVELEALNSHVSHIKEIVAMQQDHARPSPLFTTVDVAKVIEEALQIIGLACERHAVEVICHLEETPPILSSKHKLLEIFINLIKNAKEAVVEQNGDDRRISIYLKRLDRDVIRVEVRDTGVGIAQENLTRIFAHGFTTKHHGHGFGLHASAIAARQLNGSIRAESEGPGKGANFVLELAISPVAQDV